MFQQIGLPAMKIIERLAPRRDRDSQRGRIAYMKARASGATAMEAAKAQIHADFGISAVHNGMKLRVERALKLGPNHPHIRARYIGRAQMLDSNLNVAISQANTWHRTERKTLQIAELRLILRYLRAKRPHSYSLALAVMLEG